MWRLAGLALAIVLGRDVRIAIAQSYAATGRFTIPTPGADDVFGLSIAATGAQLVVGVPGADGAATDAGAVHVFDAARGALGRTLASPQPASTGLFGRAVGAADGRIVVGAPGEGAPSASGAVHIFDGGTGALLRTLLDPATRTGDVFGFALAVAATTLVVGAPLDDTAAPDAGAAYVYDAATGALRRPLTGGVGGGQFGFALAIAGARVVVGAPFDDTAAPDGGAAYVFDGSTGALLHTRASPQAIAGGHFGAALAAAGADVFVGAPSDGVAGAVYAFDVTTGALVRTFRDPSAGVGAQLGDAVGVAGGRLLAGAPYDDAGAPDAGVVVVFDALSGAVVQRLADPDTRAADFFGVAVAATGESIFVGAIGKDAGARDTGAAYVFDPCGCDACEACFALAGCRATIASGCRRSIAPGKAILGIRDAGRKHALSWAWKRGAATTTDDFGDPLATTDYTLCVYETPGGATAQALRLPIPAGGVCGGAPYWKRTKKGFRWRAKGGSPEGVQRLVLRAGTPGKAAVRFVAGGPRFDPPTLPLASPVTVQLKAAGGVCWDATYSSPRLDRAGRYVGESD